MHSISTFLLQNSFRFAELKPCPNLTKSPHPAVLSPVQSPFCFLSLWVGLTQSTGFPWCLKAEHSYEISQKPKWCKVKMQWLQDPSCRGMHKTNGEKAQMLRHAARSSGSWMTRRWVCSRGRGLAGALSLLTMCYLYNGCCKKMGSALFTFFMKSISLD